MASWDERIARTSYRFMRVSRATGEEVERIPALKGGTITRNDDVRIKENAEASLVGSYDFGPDLVRVWMDCEWAGGNSASVVLGTFLPVLPSPAGAPRRQVRGAGDCAGGLKRGRLCESRLRAGGA